MCGKATMKLRKANSLRRTEDLRIVARHSFGLLERLV